MREPSSLHADLAKQLDELEQKTEGLALVCGPTGEFAAHEAF